MSHQQHSGIPAAGNEQPVALSIEELLDELGLDFVMHTHHPLAHLEYGAPAASTGNGEFNIRNECPDPAPMATPSGILPTMASLADLL